MKILFIALCIFLLNYHAKAAPEGSVLEDTVAGDGLETDLQESADDGTETTKEVMNANDIDDLKSAHVEDVKLKFDKKKGITLTLTPDGGSAGTSYTRWGRTTCPEGAELVYDGYAAAGHYNQKGNGANFLCMPKDPQYLSTTNIPWPSCLYGSEYQTNNQIFTGSSKVIHDHNVPCAVCHVPRSAKIMVPGKVSCPKSWTREYYGYTMTSHMNHWQTLNYECVDFQPQRVPGTQRNTDGALFYFLQMECGYGIPCSSQAYIRRRAITCAICTK